ncbi:MAG TPA: ethanolamine utilization protein EutJ [Anaerolineaceae bacterium]|nr:ethanolamine utilization protein EutJ [Anaerolineaceae bacterium]
MTPLGGRSLDEYLAHANTVILPRDRSETAPAAPLEPGRKIRVGVDLGTAYLVLAVLDEDGTPLAGEWQFAQVVRDGLVVDFIGATDLLRGMKQRVERRIGRELTHAASGFPPGVPRAEVRATAHVIESAGMDCGDLVDEPTAANNVLGLRDGVIVDVGGGTTGIAVLRDGQVVYTADEPTGGTHFTLVIAGSQNIPFEAAEALKTTPAEQPRLLPVVRPVMEKVGTIVARHIRGYPVESITLVGGTPAFRGMADVVADVTGIPTMVPPFPQFVTPLGMALHDPPH